MTDSYVKKNGLIYSEDLKTVIGVDESSNNFNGRIPYGAHEILDEAFAGCDCQNISLPDSLKVLPPCLFENLTNLKSVKLPANLEEFPPYLFSGCTSLEKVKMPDTNAAFAEGQFFGCSALEEIPFIAGIQELPESCLEGCSSVKSLVIPNTVAKISSRAVADCTSLETVVLPAKLYELADDAFEGCCNIRSIRLDPDNHLFFIGEEDGCLYEHSIECLEDGPQDKLRIRINKKDDSAAKLIDEAFDDSSKSKDAELSFITDFVSEEEFEDDDTFSSEVSAELTASEEEMGSVLDSAEASAAQNIKSDTLNINNQEINNENTQEISEEIPQEVCQKEKIGDGKMENSDLDAMFADIMSDEKERTEVNSDVSVSADETKVLSEMMDVMADSPKANGSAVSQDELEKLFASHEAEATADNSVEAAPVDEGGIDTKTQILIDSVNFSKVIDCETAEPRANESDLIVIAEKTVTDDEGNEAFSPKLEACVNKIAKTQDMKRIILISGLPVENDEFMQFYHHFMGMKNVVLACSAPSLSTLSDYSKTICENSRISLEKKDLIEQRKAISIKNDCLIKLIIQDVY